MRTSLVLVLASLSLAFAPAPFPRRQPAFASDAQRIQGDWLLTTQFHNGSETRTTDGTRWVFGQGGKMQIVSGGRFDWTYSINPAATPRTLDMSFGGNVLRAVYSVDNDTLTITYNPGDWGKRPAGLRASANDLRMTFKRQR